MVLIYLVDAKEDKNGLTVNFLTKNNMAFKIKSPFNLDLLSTPMFERDMGDDPVYARTLKSGSIVFNKDEKDPYKKLQTLTHEMEHVNQFKRGDLDYGENGAGKQVVWWKGKEIDYKHMASGDPTQPWEIQPYKKEIKLNNNI
tara:strand:- start:646 stop:1074 length:429 start_codon:yes stop_codon:yes gene_type:complete